MTEVSAALDLKKERMYAILLLSVCKRKSGRRGAREMTVVLKEIGWKGKTYISFFCFIVLERLYDICFCENNTCNFFFELGLKNVFC